MAKVISIVGLGPGDPKHVTRQAWEQLTTTNEIFLRTRNHPTVDALPPDLVIHSFDYLYQNAESFSQVYSGIVVSIKFAIPPPINDDA